MAETRLAAFIQTQPNRTLGAIRILLGIVFVMTGLMKYFLPIFREAWHGQLVQANIPLPEFNFWVVPLIELTTGLLLLLGLFSRLGAVVAIGMMIVATYVHLVTDDPSLFPAQPQEPIIPAIVIVLAIYVLWRGGGAGSADLNYRDKIHRVFANLTRRR